MHEGKIKETTKQPWEEVKFTEGGNTATRFRKIQ
jgi:hypothetical protein